MIVSLDDIFNALGGAYVGSNISGIEQDSWENAEKCVRMAVASSFQSQLIF